MSAVARKDDPIDGAACDLSRQIARQWVAGIADSGRLEERACWKRSDANPALAAARRFSS
jgi:hypothetical protein